LLHQTFAPAVEVFKAGAQHYPQSAQMYNGLGIALYGEGQTDDAVRAYFRASDLVPSEQLSMIFAGKACDGASPVLADQIRARLQSFLTQGDNSAELDYDLAVCWLRTGQTGVKAERDVQVESHLKHALLLNPNYADAFFQLGVLYADDRKYAEAAAEYEQALKINPNAANTHYRLGQVLARMGKDTRAQEELAIFQRLQKSESEATDSKQNQIQQFVYSIKNGNSNQ
jgi:tetratricopeptide (TPR) repeat protein